MRYLWIALLAGCGLNPQYVQDKRDTELQSMAQSCEKLGMQRGTAANSDCALRMYEQRHGASTINVR